MNTRLKHIILLTLGLTLTSCTLFEQKQETGVLLEVSDKKLYYSDLEELIPKGLSTQDSTLYADNYIEQWVTNVLLYEQATENMRNKEEIDKMVEEYRKSLVLFNYEKELLSLNLSNEVSETDTRDYYENLTTKFVLKENLIKGLFLVVAKDASGLSNVKDWMKSSDTTALEKIEKYVIENIASYDYFLDDWLKFNEIARYYPEKIEDQERFLKSNTFAEHTDSTKTYLWYISDYQLTGETTPYEYALPEIKQLLGNKERIEFIEQFKKNLYQDAIKKGEVVFKQKTQ